MSPEVNSQYLTQLVHAPAPHPTPHTPLQTSPSKSGFDISPTPTMDASTGLPLRHSHRVTMSALVVSIAIVRGSLPSVSRAPRSAPRFRNRQASLEKRAKFSSRHPPISLPESFLPMVSFPRLPTLCGQEWWHGGEDPGQRCLLGSHLPHFGGETRRPEENSA